MGDEYLRAEQFIYIAKGKKEVTTHHHKTILWTHMGIHTQKQKDQTRIAQVIAVWVVELQLFSISFCLLICIF
jgi:hypothetical protein